MVAYPAHYGLNLSWLPKIRTFVAILKSVDGLINKLIP